MNQININSYYKYNLELAHININGLHNKLELDEVKEILNRKLFDVLFISETKIDNTVSDFKLKHPGFRILRRDRKKGGCGVLAYVRDNLAAYRRHKFEPSDLECLCRDLKDSNSSRFIVLACYRSPGKCKLSDFLKSFTSVTEETYKLRNESLLVGDLNLDMYENEKEGRKPNEILVDFFCQFNN